MLRCQSWLLAMLAGTTLWALCSRQLCAQTNVSVNGAPATVVAPVAPPPAGFFGGMGACCASCKAKLKACPLCPLVKNALKPLSALTGGIICGGPVPPPPGAPGGPPPAPACAAAAAIKADAAQAAARRDAVKFLATVDCHWYPEAESALIAALRCDRSECVRMEAALALGRGCCCTKNTVEALRIAASGSSRDGNPGERCPRVRWAALDALQTCLCNCGDTLPDGPANDRPENPPESLAPGEATVDELSSLRLSPYYAQLAARPAGDVLRDAKTTLASFQRQSTTPAAVAPTPATPRGEGLVGLWRGTQSASADASPVTDAMAPADVVVLQTPVASPTPRVETQLRRLPAPTESLPEPIYLGRQPSGSTFR